VVSDEDEARLQKKRSKLPAEAETDTQEEVSDDEEPPKALKTRVFSRASEDSRDTNGNTEVPTDLDDPGNASTGETNTSDARQGASDEEEWEYAELDEMATKDAEVSEIVLPSCFNSPRNVTPNL
jgi:hypothetical protein